MNPHRHTIHMHQKQPHREYDPISSAFENLLKLYAVKKPQKH